MSFVLLGTCVCACQMIIQHVTGLVYGKEERTVEPHTQVEKNEAKVRERQHSSL